MKKLQDEELYRRLHWMPRWEANWRTHENMKIANIVEAGTRWKIEDALTHIIGRIEQEFKKS